MTARDVSTKNHWEQWDAGQTHIGLPFHTSKIALEHIMLFKKHPSSCLLALTSAVGMMGTPLLAENGSCGTHSVDDLDRAFTKTAKVALTNGIVMGRPIPDATATAALFRLDDAIELILEFERAPRLRNGWRTCSDARHVDAASLLPQSTKRRKPGQQTKKNMGRRDFADVF